MCVEEATKTLAVLQNASKADVTKERAAVAVTTPADHDPNAALQDNARASCSVAGTQTGELTRSVTKSGRN